MMGYFQWLALALIALAIFGIIRGLDVRMVLFLTALTIASLAGDFTPVIKTFLETLSNEKFVVPICCAMGFAYVLRLTQCDQHLVRLLIEPIRKVRFLTIPGVLAVGFIVNIPVISQTSTAVCLGPVAVPLMQAAGFRLSTIAACLCLGASMGGELLNPGAPELLTVRSLTNVDTKEQAWKYILPLLIPYSLAAAALFWLECRWLERRPLSSVDESAREGLNAEANTIGKVSLLKAAVPLAPLALLFLTGPPLNLVEIPQEWLADKPDSFGSRLIGAAMLAGVFIAAAVSPRQAKDCAKSFFEGAGYGFANIVSLIVTANCFGKAIDQSGLSRVLGELITSSPDLLLPLAAVVPSGFATLSGSGMASTQSLYGFFHGPSLSLGHDPAAVGAVVSIASAAGRTMSPVAAVVLMCATLTGVKPFAIAARVAGPLIGGLVFCLVLRMTGVI